MERWARAVLLGLVVGYVVNLFSQPREEPQDFAHVFQQLDKNGDGLLTLEEFLALQPDYEQANSVMVVRSSFTPLLTDTLTKNLEEASISLKGLLDWKVPAKPHLTLSQDDLKELLPPRGFLIGDVWYLIEPSLEEAPHSSMSYTPITPHKGSAAHTLHKVLSMFHPNVFLQTRALPRGTVATLRAYNSQFFDIIFRCHAEFQLNHSPLLPFWFTPAQFMGRLIVARNTSAVVDFKMSVPSHRKLNVDLEWVNKVNDDMEVDIGFIPSMILEKLEERTTDVSSLVWDKEIPLNEAHDILDKKMFPFKEVTYQPLKKAIELSFQHQLLLHCVVLWGALDDQSC